MPVEVSVRADFKKVNRMLSGMRRVSVRRAAKRALNRTITTVKKEGAEELAEQTGNAIGLGRAGLKKIMRLHRATNRNLVARITVSGRPIPLIRFGARKVKSGVSAAAWGKRKIYKGAFIAKMKSGRKGVFKRTRKNRLPIKELYGPSLPKEFRKKKLVKTLTRKAGKIWPKNFGREIRHELRKYK